MTAWVKKKLEYHEFKYKKIYDKWTEFNDDRRLFCNMYEIIRDAILAISEVDNNFVQVAFNHEENIKYETMDEIVNYFSGFSTRELNINPA